MGGNAYRVPRGEQSMGRRVHASVGSVHTDRRRVSSFWSTSFEPVTISLRVAAFWISLARCANMSVESVSATQRSRYLSYPLPRRLWVAMMRGTEAQSMPRRRRLLRLRR